MTRFYSHLSLTAAVMTVPLLAASPTQAQTGAGDSPSSNAGTFLTSHWEAIAVGTSLIAAGLGAGILLWKRRNAPPNDGVARLPSQLQAYRKLLELEKTLAGEKREPRRAAMAALLNLVPSLVGADRSRALRRIANNFCVDWKWLMDDKAVDSAMSGKVSRWPKEWKNEIVKILSESLEFSQESIRKNATAAHKWFQNR